MKSTLSLWSSTHPFPLTFSLNLKDCSLLLGIFQFLEQVKYVTVAFALAILSAWILFPSLFAGLTISTQFLSEMLSFRISSQITNSKYPPNTHTHTHTFTILILTALCSLINVIALRAVCGMEQMLGKHSENKWICVNEWRNGHKKLAAKSEK